MSLVPTFMKKENFSKFDTFNVRMVKPVESSNDDDYGDNEFRLSTRKQTMNNLFSINEEKEISSRPNLEFNPAPFALSYPTDVDKVDTNRRKGNRRQVRKGTITKIGNMIPTNK